MTVSKLEDLQPGLRLAGVIPGQDVAVMAVQPHGADAIELTYKTGEGDPNRTEQRFGRIHRYG